MVSTDSPLFSFHPTNSPVHVGQLTCGTGEVRVHEIGAWLLGLKLPEQELASCDMVLLRSLVSKEQNRGTSTLVCDHQTPATGTLSVVKAVNTLGGRLEDSRPPPQMPHCSSIF